MTKLNSCNGTTPPWPSILPKIEATCPQWENSLEVGVGETHATQVSWLSLPGNDQDSLTRQQDQGFSQGLYCNQARECISINQMTSNEVGFYKELKGKLTKEHYKCAAVFVNHFSRLRFVHLQIDDSSAKTVAPKRAFKLHAVEQGVKIKHTTNVIMGALQQLLPESIPQSKTTACLLWRKLPLAKWHCQASHLRPVQERTQAATSRLRLLAQGSALCLVAICPAQCSAPPL